MKKYLVIQTASIGDVILATPVLEHIHSKEPGSTIDILIKKGNESLFRGHPFLHRILTWDKGRGKYLNLLKLILMIRKNKYHHVINLQRFASSGLITVFSGSKSTIGFNKNPLSVFYTHSVRHEFREDGLHEVMRNLKLTEKLFGKGDMHVRLYPSSNDYKVTTPYSENRYICIAPASLWFTKQLPGEKWIELIKVIPLQLKVILVGAAGDFNLCEQIKSGSGQERIMNLAGKLSLLETAALFSKASMNFVNDSAPMHLASAMNAPVTAVYCSTVPSFGFGPLSDHSVIVETKQKLDCRPCGIHGFSSCPQKHFLCAYSIDIDELIQSIR